MAGRPTWGYRRHLRENLRYQRPRSLQAVQLRPKTVIRERRPSLAVVSATEVTRRVCVCEGYAAH